MAAKGRRFRIPLVDMPLSRALDMPLSRALGKFGAWWSKELLAFLPERTAEWLMGSSRKVLVIVPEGPYVDMALINDARLVLASERADLNAFSMTDVERFLKAQELDGAAVDVGVRLPPNQIFHRTLTLPVQTEAQLDHVTLRDLAAKTPFRLQDVYVGFARSEAGDAKTIVVFQWIVLRQIVSNVAASLKVGIDEFAFVETSPSQNGVVPNIPLRSDSSRGGSWFPRTVGALALSALLLASIAAATEYWRQQSSLETLDAKVAAARVKAQRVRDAINKLEQHQAVVQQLRAKKFDTPGFLDLWEETTRVLPSHSWLTEFRVSQAPSDNAPQTSMIGFSSAASTLVGLVDQSALFTEASLTAPVTLDPVQGRERFSLQAKLRRREAPTKIDP